MARIYQHEIDHKTSGMLVGWATSERKARKAQRDLIEAMGKENCIAGGIYPREIPTTVSGIVEWLNTHVRRT